ncbi:putative zinc-binding protein [Maridesulfovibrio sp.]|uniref:putative zinc-binding protein n=1 Tax=Maridesulfovibrio sp. TaxID=2795000 RepID=UPI002A18E79F|nr:putative zinc-binding protein [Maridesulfovibrio sp.]
MSDTYETGFLVVSCSGCSCSGQATNDLAVELNRSGFARMVCLAGIAAGLDNCVADAANVQDLIVIDGCVNACAKKVLEKAGIKPVHTFCLTEMGLEGQDTEIDSELLEKLRLKIKQVFGQSRTATKYAVCGCETCVRE